MQNETIMNVLQKLTEKNKFKKTALLIRHADRNIIPQGSLGDEIQLNTRGKQNAFNFGKKLINFPVNKFYTSPIMRCRQTAKHTIKGYKKEVRVETSTVLGDPGAYVYKPEAIGEYYLKKGFEAIYKEYITGKKVPGLRGEEGSTILYNFLKEKTEKEGLTIFITHDVLIAYFNFHRKGKVYTKENWIPFLGGVLLEF